MAKILSTTFTGDLKSVDMRHSQRWDILDWLEDKCQRKMLRYQKTLPDHIGNELYTQLISGLKTEAESLEGLVDFKMFLGEKEHNFELQFFTTSSKPNLIRDIFRLFAKSKSNLAGLRGKKLNRRDEYVYTVNVDCRDGSTCGTGIIRLARLYIGVNQFILGRE